MHRYLLHNGEIVDSGGRIVSPGQVGLMNGWGVFSTIRVYKGVMFSWERHLARMRKDAARMRVPFPEDGEKLEADLYRLIDANDAQEATLRVVVVRNQGGMWQGPAATEAYDTMGFTTEVNNWSSTVKLGLVPNGRHAASEFAGTKYTSWSENLMRYERAREQGLDEVILLNERGEVCECTSANVFAVHGNTVSTPPLSSGCLPGVTRWVLLDELRVPQIEVRERILLPADLESADEVFITSTTRELLTVASIEGLRVSRANRVRDALQAAFSAYVQTYVSSHARPVPTAA